jgi:hypothetical protein
MPAFLFSYRVPRDYQSETRTLGDCGPGTRLGGYSVITAGDLGQAVALAQDCPALALGAGLEVGLIVTVGPGPEPAAGN